jgi:membrane protein insertase Oxa1/YidC/SpoIIIJ
VLSEQEQVTQGVVNNLPFIVAFFSINVPAGLALYWIVNNALTTAVTLAVKASIKDEGFPDEVQRMMALVDKGPSSGSTKRSSAASTQQLRRPSSMVEDRPKVEGFGSQQMWNVEEGEGGIIDAEVVGEEEGEEEEWEEEDEEAPKRKKRVKPTKKAKKAKRE